MATMYKHTYEYKENVGTNLGIEFYIEIYSRSSDYYSTIEALAVPLFKNTIPASGKFYSYQSNNCFNIHSFYVSGTIAAPTISIRYEKLFGDSSSATSLTNSSSLISLGFSLSGTLTHWSCVV